ncbi:MAG: MiaB/RimO family radical SAM methylthiotransferase [Candidatus Nanopelagicales bacterium]
MSPRVSLVRLGCARNDVDSDEIESRLAGDGFELVDDRADVIVVNTCGFIASAKKDSIDAVLAASDTGAQVVVAGCLAERYGHELAESLPEAAAVLSFDDYASIGDRLRSVLAGEPLAAHVPQDRRLLLPLSPVERVAPGAPGHAGLSRAVHDVVVPVKLASGCDRRCSFCAIPRFRGSFVSRPPEDIVAEVIDLAGQGVREIVLVSENSTSYGKDLGDLRLLERLLRTLGEIPGIARVRVNYLQPAEMRPSLVEAIGSSPGVAAYYDLSFQHASARVLRRMRRFGGSADFLGLIDAIRRVDPRAGVRTNVIVGFPGESEDDLDELADFLVAARLDAVGVFPYSDEDDTEALGLDGHLDEQEVLDRASRISSLVDDLVLERAESRVGESVQVLVTGFEDGRTVGRAAHQGPDDGATFVESAAEAGEMLMATVMAADGVDLVAR